MSTQVEPGQVVYLSISERTDEFRHKRYSSIYRGRTVIIRAVVQDVKGTEFRAQLEGNNGFERDGQTYVFHTGSLLANQDFKKPEELGVWKEWDHSEYASASPGTTPR